MEEQNPANPTKLLMLILAIFVVGVAIFVATNKRNSNTTNKNQEGEIVVNENNEQTLTGQGTITGKICWPSEGVPAGQVMAKELASGEITSINTTQNQSEYSMDLEVGRYVVKFANGTDENALSAYYTPCAESGSAADVCEDPESHVLTIVDVEVGATTTEVDLCDSYYGEDEPKF